MRRRPSDEGRVLSAVKLRRISDMLISTLNDLPGKEVGDIMSEVAAYGTAVTVRKLT